MKKAAILSAFLFVLSFGVNAQVTKQDTVRNYTYASIDTVSVFPNKCTRITIDYKDNMDMKNPKALFNYYLSDWNGKVWNKGQVLIYGNEYKNWDANNPDATYIMICAHLNLTIKIN